MKVGETGGVCSTHVRDKKYIQNKRVKLSLCLIKYHAMKTFGGMEVYLHTFLTSALDGDE